MFRRFARSFAVTAALAVIPVSLAASPASAATAAASCATGSGTANTIQQLELHGTMQLAGCSGMPSSHRRLDVV